MSFLHNIFKKRHGDGSGTRDWFGRRNKAKQQPEVKVVEAHSNCKCPKCEEKRKTPEDCTLPHGHPEKTKELKKWLHKTAAKHVGPGSKHPDPTLVLTGIPKEAVALILSYEISDKCYYDRYLKKPTYPGGASGVTIGVGYDLGYASRTKIAKDWGPYVSKEVLERLVDVAGKKRTDARNAVRHMKDIEIPYDVAREVFVKVTLPNYIAQTKKAFPGSEDLNPLCFGALVSIVFNRGGSLRGATRAEMKRIHDAIVAQHPELPKLYDYIADEVVAMKRLWYHKGLNGLLARRDSEAKLIRKSK